MVLFGISYFLAPFMYRADPGEFIFIKKGILEPLILESKGETLYQLIVTYTFVIVNGLQVRV